MWKIVLGIGGILAGAGLAATFVHFAPISLLVLAGLMMGNLGVVVGMVFDARAVTRQAVLGLLGFLLGAPFGGFLTWYFASFQDTFSEGGLAGIFLGVPIGALLGSAMGIFAGTRVRGGQNEAEPCREPERPTTRILTSESLGGRPVTAVVRQVEIQHGRQH